MNKTRYIMYTIGLGALGVFGILMCALWYPFSTAVNFGYIMPDAIVNLYEFYSVLAFYYVASIPCFVMVGMMIRAVRSAYKTQRMEQIAVCIRRCARILTLCIAIFLVGNIVLSVLEYNTYAVIYYAFCVLGVAGIFISRRVCQNIENI